MAFELLDSPTAVSLATAVVTALLGSVYSYFEVVK